MIQFVVGGEIKKRIMGENARPLTTFESLGTGLTAGVVSAFVGSPLELIMIQQQHTGKSSLETAKSIMSPSKIGRGFAGAAVREGLWTVGYLSIPPLVRSKLMTNFPDTFDSSAKARVPASLLGGLFACYLTQPFDTIKTCMQGDLERRAFGTFTETAKKIGEDGFTAFYRGATFRYARMVCAVFMMDTLQGAVGPLLYPNAFK